VTVTIRKQFPELKILFAAPPNPNRNFPLYRWEIAVFNRDIFKVQMDLEVLHGIADQLGNEHIGYQALFAANEMVTLLKRGQTE
jgi:alpha-mannosidase